MSGVTLSLLAAPFVAGAQQAGKVYRIGFVGNSTPALEANLVGPFREELARAQVTSKGKDHPHRISMGGREVRALSRPRRPELLAWKVDVIVTAGTPASHAVKKATTSIPLVMVTVGDRVASGLVPSLTRPAGNITGLTSIGDELEGKRLELLRDLIPTISTSLRPDQFRECESEEDVRGSAGRRRGAAH